MSRREIRQATNWSDWQVRAYCDKLVEMEYLYLMAGGNGKTNLYKLALPCSDDRPLLRGLTDVRQLKERLTEQLKEKWQPA